MFVGCRRGAGPEQASSWSRRRADRQRVHGQSRFSRRRLGALGLRPKKRLSQSFLEDQRVAAAIVRAAQLDASSDVLEVGPGLGVLTTRLARVARRVVAVELDPELARSIEGDNVAVVNADILTFDPARTFEGPYTVVANLPYHITSPALRHLLGGGPPYAQRLVVMVQAEVAERMAAKPGALSALAVTIQAQASVRILRKVPKEAFYPRPKVDSAVVVLEPLTERSVQRNEVEAFATLVQAGFKQPRKTIANSFADGLRVTKAEATQRLERAGIDPTRRPEALQLQDWIGLFRSA